MAFAGAAQGPGGVMKVHLASLGCKLNQSEVEAWARELAALGCEIVAEPEQADLCVANTCAVTHVAARKSRQLVRRLGRVSPGARLVVTGCYAELNATEVQALASVALVAGTAQKEHLVSELVRQLDLPAETTARQREHDATERGVTPAHLRTRALIKIQDGCDNTCTYCIVRVARGKQRSASISSVVAEIQAREREGYQEAVLTGVHIGAFGRERGESLADLLRAILGQTSIPRIRASSIEPWDLTDELLALWQDRRLCPHLHLPLQSGCDATLQRMGRRCSSGLFLDLVQRARAAIPDLAVATDIIVGFPGENEDEFSQTVHLAEEVGFARIHVFPYSARPGTVAAAMPDRVCPDVAQSRVARLLELGRRCSRDFRAQYVGRAAEVLWESQRDGMWNGLTGNYIRVETQSAADLHNRITPVRLTGMTEQGLQGELLTSSSQIS